MLSHGVVTQGLYCQDILCIAFRSRWCQKTLRPIALVQQAMEEIRFSVETQTGIPADFLHFQAADGKIGFDPVFSGSKDKIIEEGILRAPEMGIFRGNGDGAIFQSEVFQPFDFHESVEGRFCGNGDRGTAVFDVQFPDVGFRNTFQPDGLPDAGNRGIPHAAPLFRQNLLAVRILLQTQIVHTADLQGIILLKRPSDVHCKGLVTAFVMGHMGAVHIDIRHLVGSTDV